MQTYTTEQILEMGKQFARAVATIKDRRGMLAIAKAEKVLAYAARNERNTKSCQLVMEGLARHIDEDWAKTSLIIFDNTSPTNWDFESSRISIRGLGEKGEMEFLELAVAMEKENDIG